MLRNKSALGRLVQNAVCDCGEDRMRRSPPPLLLQGGGRRNPLDRAAEDLSAESGRLVMSDMAES